MKNKVIMFLEEYARLLSEEVAELLETEEREGDEVAGQKAKDTQARIIEIRRIVSYLSLRGSLKD